MTNAQHTATVQRIYEAFGRGDVPAILAEVTDDVTWDAWAHPSAARSGVPWLGALHGKDGVQRFFTELGSALDFDDFRVVSLLEGPDRVGAEIEFTAHVRATGHEMSVEELHVWTFAPDGRVQAYRDYVDTAKDLEALAATG